MLMTSVAVAQQAEAQTSGNGGHSISVKLLDAETGKPVKGVWVLPLELREKSRFGNVYVKTNSQGIAHFQLPEPPPERIEFLIPPDEFGFCSEVQFVTYQILETGTVGGNSCQSRKPKPLTSTDAGQVVIFGKRITLWQRILREIP
jgi:hypothetical protein